MALLAMLFPAGPAAAFQLAPYKDDLFANPAPFRTLENGAFTMVEYSVERDFHGRDEIPEKRAHEKFVSLLKDGDEQRFTVRDGPVETIMALAGNPQKPATAVVIFLHGRDADHQAGFDDWTFGGNFNRIKNLMVRNGGLYGSPSFSDFRQGGQAQIKAVIRSLTAKSPSAPVFLVCASAAGALCTALAADPEAGPRLGGVLLLGAGVKDVDAAARAYAGSGFRVPVFIGHGSKDKIVNWVRQELFFKSLRKLDPDYPIRFTLYAGGQHGTPMRMVDWRAVLNWMLSLEPG